MPIQIIGKFLLFPVDYFNFRKLDTFPEQSILPEFFNLLCSVLEVCNQGKVYIWATG